MIAIVAPYCHGETTWAALRVANVLAKTGATVAYLTYGPVGRKLHSYWDGRVLSAAKFRNLSRLSKATHIVNFGFPPEMIGADKALRIFVPSSYPIPREKVGAWLKTCHRSVFPSRHARAKYAKLVANASESLNVAHWTSEAQFARREGAIDPRRVKVCVHCDSATIDGSSQFALTLIRELLQRYDNLDMTLLSEKSWTRAERQEQRQLRAAWAGRLTFVRQSVPLLWSDIYLKNDWLLLPSLRSDFGAAAAQSLGCGVPIIAPQIPPFSEMINHHHSGILVPSLSTDLSLRHPLSVPILGNWLEACDRAFRNHSLLLRLQTNDWAHDRSRRSFDESWCRWLEIA